MDGPNTVRAERLRRGWSVRSASSAGGISNTWWHRYEDGLQPLTPKIVQAVARAFGWPDDWPVSLPTVAPADALAALQAQVAELEARLHARVDDLARAVDRLSMALPTTQGAAEVPKVAERRPVDG